MCFKTIDCRHNLLRWFPKFTQQLLSTIIAYNFWICIHLIHLLLFFPTRKKHDYIHIYMHDFNRLGKNIHNCIISIYLSIFKIIGEFVTSRSSRAPGSPLTPPTWINEKISNRNLIQSLKEHDNFSYNVYYFYHHFVITLCFFSVNSLF